MKKNKKINNNGYTNFKKIIVELVEEYSIKNAGLYKDNKLYVKILHCENVINRLYIEHPYMLKYFDNSYELFDEESFIYWLYFSIIKDLLDYGISKNELEEYDIKIEEEEEDLINNLENLD